MTLTIELYACNESGTPVTCTVPDASLPAGAALGVQIARALERVAPHLPRAVEVGDIVVVDGARYFITARGLQAVPVDYRPSLSDLLIGFADVQPDAG
jgi:hypothetical protein